eukprot:Plantae.Rhodophyta-Hildenbrandia_rubra.ctg11136.p2 GENE.Plantae.Rhodophyta-Hildenbrandia_rubra.ctg11136~~Plantae.Rhodophyta-Hildenbrandia_rubra.ctg11136.p2  ORF type:complete len:460 (-),score=111.97 Plantae.Rhodophyta-Hildenbrandia_rubra.ctg11136:2089-3468(-)
MDERELLKQAEFAVHQSEAERRAGEAQNVGEGALGLIGHTFAGIGVGVGAVILGPIAGYKADGGRGLAKGAIGGLALGVTAPLAGAASGIGKLGQGFKRQFGKEKKRIENEVVAPVEDEDQAAYESERQELYRGLEGLHLNHENGNGSGALGSAKETGFYEVLGVSEDANSTDIRKAYYKKAQLFHPDKHPGDENASKKFQDISAAYQVLSDPVKRERYHRLGKESALADEALMDPKKLYNLMFGNEKFAHLVGDLATATIMSQEASYTTEEEIRRASEVKKNFQETREKQLAALLAQRLDQCVNGNRDAFIHHAEKEVRVLRAEPFGRDMLRTIGYVYREKGQMLLKKHRGPLGIRGFFAELEETGHMFSLQLKALDGSMRLLSKSNAGDASQSVDEHNIHQAVTALGAVWLASVIDIETTLRKVVQMVVTDPSLPKDTQYARAKAVIELGKVFEAGY